MKYLLLIFMLIPATLVGQYHVTVTGGGAHTGLDVSNAWTMAEANGGLSAGDTAYIHAGTYTTAIDPSFSGTSGNPIVYKNYASDVCSLNVSTGTAVVLTQDYVHIIGIRARTAWTVAGHALDVNGSSHFLLQYCRFYGGTTRSGQGDYTSFRFLDAHYGRIYNCLFDRQDPVVANPSTDNQGDGVTWYESSHLIFEYDTVKNVSHAAWYGPGTRFGSSPPWAQLNYGPFVMRNCVAFDAHNCYDLQNAGNTILIDGCKGWSPMVKSLDKGGHTTEWAIERSIIRYSMFYNDTVRTQTSGGMNNALNAFICMSYMGPYALRVYNNVFLASPGDSPYAWTLFISDDGNLGQPYGKSVYANNMIVNPIDTIALYYQDKNVVAANIRDTLKGNLVWDGTPGGYVADIITSGVENQSTITTAKTYNSSFFQSSNIEASPLWVDSFSVRERRSFEISGTSLARDAGVALTRLRANASSSTVLQVADAKYFWYPHSNTYDRGDSIAVSHGGSWTRCLVDSVDTTNNNIVVHAAVTLSAGDSVYLLAGYVASTGTYTNRLSGTRPDIGAYEYASGGSSPAPSAPDSTTNVAPANGSTQAQPVTFRWRSVSGATQYLLTASWSNWVHDDIYAVVTDTFYTYSGMPVDTTVIWNVAAGNSSGWSVWDAIWSFRTQANVEYNGSVVVDWNNLTETVTLTENSVVSISNLQRIYNFLVVRNPLGSLLQWPSTIHWLNGNDSPQPAVGDTTIYLFVRDGTQVHGMDLSASTGGSSASTVTTTWVLTQLNSYLRKDANIRITGNGELRSITLVEESGSDSVIMRINSGNLEFWDAANGWKTLTDLADIPLGSGDITGVAAGYGILGGGVSGDVTVSVDSSKFTRQDTTGYATSDSTTQVLTVHKGTVRLATRPSGGGGISAAAVHDSLVARSDDYATPTHTHTGVYQPAGTYLVPSDTSLHLKRTDTTWVMYRSKSDALYQAKGTYLVPADTNLHLKRTDTTWINYRSRSDASYQAKGTYLVPADTNLHVKRTDTTWVAYKSWVTGTLGGYIPTSGGTITNGKLTLYDSYAAADSSRFLVTKKGTSTQTNLAASMAGSWDAYIFGWNNGFTEQNYWQIGRAHFQTDYDANGRFDNSTFKVRLAGDNTGALADVFSITPTAATFSGNITASSGYLNANGIYNSQTYWRMWGSASWMDIITSVTVGSQKKINIDSVNYINGGYLATYLGTPSEGQILKWTSGLWALRTDSLGSGTGGVADGQNADSLNGKILDTLGRDQGGLKYTVPAYVPDSTKYKHIRLAYRDTTGMGTASTNGVYGPSVTGDSVKIKTVLLVSDTSGNNVTTQTELINYKKSAYDYRRSNADTWYGPDHGSMTTAPTTQACVASTVRAFPFYVGQSYSIDSVRFEVSTGVSGNIALAIYEDSDGDMYPDNRVLDLGAYTVTSTAVKGDTLTAPLGASTSNGSFTFQANKLYFIGVHSNTTATLRAVAQTSMPHLLGWNSAMSTNSQYTAWNRTSVTYTYPNSAPNPYGASGAFLANTACPLVIWRVKP